MNPNPSLRSYTSMHLFRDNPLAITSALFLIPFAVLLGLPAHTIDSYYPQHAWAQHGFRFILIMFCVYLYGGLLFHYWRQVTEPMVVVVPRFIRRHRQTSQWLILGVSTLPFFALIRFHAPWPGALVLTGLFALLGTGFGGIRVPWKKRRWAQYVLRGLLIVFYLPLIVVGSLYWDIGSLPLLWALPLAVVIWSAIMVSLFFRPERLRSLVEAQETQYDVKSDYYSTKISPSIFRYWRVIVRWAPQTWKNPLALYPMGVLSVVLIGTAGVLVTLFIAVIVRRMTHPMISAVFMHHAAILSLVTGGTLAVLLVSAANGYWIQQNADWRTVFLTGLWGSKKQFCRQALRHHARQSIFLAGVLTLTILALSTSLLTLHILQGVALTAFLFTTILWLSYAFFFAYLFGLHDAIHKKIIHMLVFGLSYLVVNLGLLALLQSSTGFRFWFFGLCMPLLLVIWVFFTHRQTLRKMVREDWVLDATP
ncbi:MAG: ABC transporter permease [Acidithiobacillus sp.]